MKKILVNISILLLANFTMAQVAIGKSTIEGDALLDFGSGSAKGILLPVITDLPASPANGTFLMDSNDLTVKVYENDQWVGLTEVGAISGIPNTTDVILNSSDEVGEGIIIGSETSSASGVLVLEAADKAMVLPKVANPAENIKSPRAGMMCYDTTNDVIAIFDGNQWNFWE